MNLKMSPQKSHRQSPIFKEMITQLKIVQKRKRALENMFLER